MRPLTLLLLAPLALSCVRREVVSVTKPCAKPPEPGAEPPRAELALGRAHGCMLRAPGELLCWGDNAFGQLGDGTTTARPRPTKVKLEGPIAHVGAGGDHTCTTREGEAHCWGRNDHGELAGVPGARVLVPTRVPDLAPSDGWIPALSSRSTCFEDHAEYESGAYCFGALAGFPFYETYAGVPCKQGVPCSMWITQVAGHDDDVCFLARGYGANVRLSCSPKLAPQWKPEAVALEPSSVAVGSGFACALLENGDVACFRREARVAERVEGVHLARALCAGERFACVIAPTRPADVPAQHDVICWGQLGDRVARPADGVVGQTTDPRALACGARHACVLDAERVRCFGDNESGQLGDGTTKTRWTLDFQPISGPN